MTPLPPPRTAIIKPVPPKSPASRRYLRPEDLRRLRHLVFTSRRRVEGPYAGRHVSPHRGHSAEFADYRPYMPGDEIGDIDWKVFGRSDRLYIKLFEHHSDMTLHLVLDASASMGYAGIDASNDPAKRHSKFDHAAQLATAIAFLTLRQQDQASLTVAQEGVRAFHRPSASMAELSAWAEELERIEPAGESKLAAALRQVARSLPRRGLLIVLSDLLDERQPLLDALSLFTHRGSEVILFHVMHAEELVLPELDGALFTDSETAAHLAVHIPDVRAAYDARMRRFLETWRTACRARRIDYQLVSTATDYVRILERFWGRR